MFTVLEPGESHHNGNEGSSGVLSVGEKVNIEQCCCLLRDVELMRESVAGPSRKLEDENERSQCDAQHGSSNK
eukprot:scaffold293551_cov31-Tisochrysis_lutea.AAC.1